MATDFAKIGFGVDTSQLEEGVAALNTFNSSAKSANSTAKSIGAAMNSSSKVFAAAVSAMSKSIASFVSVTKGASVEQIAAANEASDFADVVYRAAKAENTLAGSIEKTTNALKNQLTPMQKIINNLTGVGSSVGFTAKESKKNFKDLMTEEEYRNAIGVSSRGLTEAQQISRFNTSNIAAQFQDIAVTAAMGMNPMTIALQQGSQLVGVLNLMEKPLISIVEAFKSLFNTTSLVTIGLTGLVAAGLQMVDWTSVAINILDGLKSAFQFASQYANELGVTLTGLSVYAVASNASFILLTAQLVLLKARIIALSAASAGLSVLGTVATVILNPFVLLTGVVVGLAEAFLTFKNEIKNALDSVIQNVIDFVNKTIGYFVGLKNVIKEIPDIVKTARDDGFSAANDKITEIMNKAMEHKFISDETVKNAQESMNKVIDTVANGVQTMNDAVSTGADKLGGYVKSGLDSATNAFDKMKTKLTENSDEMKKAWEDLQTSALQDISDVRMDRSLLGKSTYDATYEKTQYDLINQAKQQGLTLDKDRLTVIKELSASKAEETVLLESQTKALEAQNEVLDFYKSTTKSFFSDLKQGLRDGESAWESFGNAALNVLDRIADKMMDVAIDALFDNSSASGSKKSSGGWLNSLINMGLKAGLAYGTGGADVTGQAGNIAASSGGQITMTNASYTGPFAKGGVFTNGVYDSPTMFKFANGGKFGVMGEAGPEAVMPLRRGPDGSLGVKADGFGGGDVVVNVINNSDSTARTEKRQTENGTEIDIIIDRMVANKMNENGSASNSALVAFNNRSLTLR